MKHSSTRNDSPRERQYTWVKRTRYAAALVGLHLLAPACAYEALSEEEVRQLERDPDAEIGVQASAIENGALESIQRGVVEIVMRRNPADEWSQSCTGALVNDRNVLTAAHCVDDIMDAWVDDELNIQVLYFDPDTYTKNMISRRLLRGAILPGWNCFHASADCYDGQADLAILSHDEPWIGAEPGHSDPFTQLSTRDYLRISAGSLNSVTALSLYGRGAVTDAGNGVGTLRSMPIVIDHKHDYYFYSLASFKSACLGDSGGPYIGTVNDRRVIVGVHSSASAIDNYCTTWGAKQYATRTSAREDWIKQRLGPHNCEDGPEYYRCF